MDYKKQNVDTTKNSSSVPSSKLLQALQKIFTNKGGSVSYVFISERFERENFVNKKGEMDFFLKPIEVKSTLHVNLTEEVLKSNDPKKLYKTPYELFEMFQTTKHDLGASHFILD